MQPDQNETPEYDLTKTLEWCADNEVFFQITNHSGVMAITARRDNIFAEYTIHRTDAEDVGRAVWAALFAVKTGTEFHGRYGHYPPAPGKRSRAEGGAAEDSRAGGGSGENEDAKLQPPSPMLSPDDVPRRP